MCDSIDLIFGQSPYVLAIALTKLQVGETHLGKKHIVAETFDREIKADEEYEWTKERQKTIAFEFWL